MAAVRPIDLSARRGALLAGIPLLIGGLAPINLDPLQFPWDVAAQTNSVRPLLIPAAGLMITAVGLLPGLPRLVRGLLLLVFVTVPAYFSFDLVSGMGGEQAGHFVQDMQGKLLVVTIGLAAVTEMMLAWKKVSKVLAALAMAGWLSFVVVICLPSPGGEPLLINMLEGLMRLGAMQGFSLQILGGWLGGIPLLLTAFALLGAIFAFIRLVRSPEGMLHSPYKSGWAGILMAGSVSLFVTGILVLGAISMEVYAAIPPAVGAGLMFWGLSLGITAGLAHTILGLMAPPGPIPARDFAPAKAAQPRMAGAPAPYAHPAYPPEPPPTPMPSAQPFAQPTPQPLAQPSPPPYGPPAGQPYSEPFPGPYSEPEPTTPLPPEAQPARPSPGQDYSTRDQVNVQQQLEAARRRSQDYPAVGAASGTDPGYPRQPYDQQPPGGYPGPPAAQGWPSQPQYQPAGQPGMEEPYSAYPPQYGGAGGQAQWPSPPQAWPEPQAPPAGPPGPSAPPRPPALEPYPGYPGYYICPNQQCRGGVALNSPTCPHCGREIAW